MSTIYITGKNGFVCKALTKGLAAHNKIINIPKEELNSIETYNFESDSIIIHPAGRVHVMKETSDNPLQEFREINVDITTKLAKKAAQDGVKHLIFFSSVAVYGRFRTGNINHLTSTEVSDPYGQSKLEAENNLKEISETSSLQVTSIRPPMIYGEDCKGNMLSLIKQAKMGRPLPLATVTNKRSFLYIGNLVDAVETILKDTMSYKYKSYLISDDYDLTSKELYHYLFKSFWPNKMSTFFFPTFLLILAAKIFDIITAITKVNFPLNSSVISRLFDQYTLDIHEFKNDYNWSAPTTPQQGLENTANFFNKSS